MGFENSASAQARKLSLLRACIDETLRLHPPVTRLPGRVCGTDKVLPDGLVIPAGTTAAVDIYSMQRHWRHWRYPSAWLPSRWLDGRVDKSAFMPFGAGARGCIGKAFAYAEAEALLAAILLEFEVLPAVHQPEEVDQVVLTSRNGLPVKFRPLF